MADSFYHVYNRAPKNEFLFYKDENYLYFLKLYKDKVADEVNTLAYCLLQNHFHFLIETPESADSAKISKCFSRLFQSYSQAINRQQNRYGSLFCKPFKRKRIDSSEYLNRTIAYIHQNPQLHELVDDFREYRWSSYKSHLSDKETLLERSKVLSWFGGMNDYVDFHDSIIAFKGLDFE